MTRTRSRYGARALPGAFTLIEILIVLTIIAVLMAISAGVYFQVMATQENSATATMVTKVQNALTLQYAKVKQLAESETLPPPAANANLLGIYNNTVLPAAGNDPVRARVIWVKLKLQRAFPMTFNEALNPTIPQSLFTQQLNLAGITGPFTGPPGVENSACLLLALQQNVSGGVSADEVSKLSVRPFATGNGTSINALVDPFHLPLAFCRWPTGYTVLNPGGNPQSGFNDPEDRLGTLTDPTWVNSSGALFSGNPLNLHPVQASLSYKLQPVVVSVGRDKLLGLNPTNFANDGTANSNDNVVARTTP
jgi:prepilin-type N-terminal cleavage/methylation domain-containing protein